MKNFTLLFITAIIFNSAYSNVINGSVENQNAPVVSLGNDTVICEGDEVTLDAGSGFDSYNWSTGETTQTIDVNSSGTYSVTVTKGECTASDAIQVTVNPAPVVDLGGPVKACTDEDVVLDAGEGFKDYLWNTGSTSQTLQIYASGDYSVTVTDNFGCKATDQITAEIIEPPFIDPYTVGGAFFICEGDTFTLDAGEGFGSYLWSTGETTHSIEVTEEGTYSVTVYDDPACVTERSTAIEVISPPPLELEQDPEICEGQSVSLAASDGFDSYLWNTGETGRTIEVSEAGNYSVTATKEDIMTCSRTAETHLTVHEAPVVSLGNDTVICEGDAVTLDADSGFDTYNWSTGETTQTIDVNSSGTYSVTVTKGECTASDAIQVTVNPAPVVDLGGPVKACSDEDVVLDAGDGFKDYLWNTGSTSQTLQIHASGDYSVTVTDNFGCKATDQITAEIIEPPFIDPYTVGGAFFICEGDTFTLDAGEGFGSYLWSTGETTHSIEVTEEGTYSVTVYDDPACVTERSTAIEVISPPPLELEQDPEICEGQSVSLTASDGFDSYLWNTGETGRTIEVSEAGNYSVTATKEDIMTCSRTAETHLTVHDAPVVSLGNDTSVYVGEHIILDAGEGFSSYLWNTGAGSREIDVIEQDPGNYMFSVVVTDEYGCSNSDTVEVFVDASNSISGVLKHTRVDIYPNPTDGKLYVTSESDITGTFCISIYDYTGKLMLQKTIEKMFSDNPVELNLSSYKKGIYIMQLNNYDKVTIRKIILR